MRYGLYVHGQGWMLPNCHGSCVAIRYRQVVDWTVLAYKKGIRRGLLLDQAKLLVPELQHIEADETTDEWIEKIRRVVFQRTPWVQTFGWRTLAAELSGKKPPLKESLDIFKEICALLTSQQRVVVSLAETASLARSMLWWRSHEKIPNSLEKYLNGNLFLVSPGLLRSSDSKEADKSESKSRECDSSRRLFCPESVSIPEWFLHFPLHALSRLSESDRVRLRSLGIHRLGQLLSHPIADVKSQFGSDFSTELLGWLSHSGRIHVNYPTNQLHFSWEATMFEEPTMEHALSIIGRICQRASRELLRREVFAQRVLISWKSNAASGCFEIHLKNPTSQADILLPQIKSCLSKIRGTTLERLKLSIPDFSRESGLQSCLHSIQVEEKFYKENLCFAIDNIEKRFPGKLHKGIRPSYRELLFHSVLQEI
ncbi:MAG: hypothetical protein OWQ59_03790 [Alicyclobacillaceae bacterium]|nr:hypothetical protein [Alicyclobacillaceae bacterium]